MARYIFSHGYEGRLGKEAFANRGLVYYIDTHYESDGQNGWITLDMGVDSDKLPAMKKLLRTTLNELKEHPPTQAEVDEARQHLLGRYRSAAQSNSELADRLARDWFWYGRPLALEELQQRLDAVERQDVIDLVPDFTAGATVSILNPQAVATPAATLGAVEQ
jgi:predicted Zn-dependent peptidase